MKLNKIGLMLVSLSSVFFASSCKQSSILTYKQAQAWITKNCVAGKSTPTSGYRFFEFSKTFGDKARDYVKNEIMIRFGVVLDDNLISRQEMERESLKPASNLTVGYLEILSTGGNAMFNVYNNKLAVTAKYDISSFAGLEGIAYRTWQFNKKGAILLDEWSFYYMKSEYLGERAAIIGKHNRTYSYK